MRDELASKGFLVVTVAGLFSALLRFGRFRFHVIRVSRPILSSFVFDRLTTDDLGAYAIFDLSQRPRRTLLDQRPTPVKDRRVLPVGGGGRFVFLRRFHFGSARNSTSP